MSVVSVVPLDAEIEPWRLKYVSVVSAVPLDAEIEPWTFKYVSEVPLACGSAGPPAFASSCRQ